MLRTIFVALIMVPGFFLALKDRFAALLLYFWFAFFRPQDWIWIDISSLQPSLLLGLVLVVPSVLSGLLPDLVHPLSIGTMLFLMSSFIAQVTAVNAAVGWNWIDYLTRLILVCLLSVTLNTTLRRQVAVIAVVSGSFGFHAAKAGLASLLGGGLRFFDGLSGSFIDNNGYALGTVMIMPLLIATAENLDVLVPADRPAALRWIRRGFWLAVPLCSLTVISTFSRAGFLALVAATLVFVALHRRRVRSALMVSALVVGGLMFVPLPEGYADRVETIQTYDEVGDVSAISRPHFWQVAMAMANAQPFGVGLRNFEFAYDKYDFSDGRYGRGRSVHSSHFQVLAELGYFGALIWIGLFAAALFYAFRVRARSRTPGLWPSEARFLATVSTALVTSMVGFLVGGGFIALALNDVTWLTFALVAALDRLSAQLCADAEARTKPIAVSSPIAALPAAWRRSPAVAAQQLPRNA
jgi:putative inorganic carbon (HCO3(-)) transporter